MRARRDHFDLVFLNMSLPDGDGQECFVILRELDPDVKIMLSSGYGLDSRIENLVKAGAVGFLGKPYRAAQLAEVLKDVLGVEL